MYVILIKIVNCLAFTQFLIGAGMKKVVLVGIGPIGCAPNFLSSYNSSVGECIPEINSLVQEYNDNLNLLTLRLRSEFPDSRIIFCDIFKGVYDIILNAKEYGKAALFFNIFLKHVWVSCFSNCSRNKGFLNVY